MKVIKMNRKNSELHGEILMITVSEKCSTQNGMCNDINVGKYLEMHTKMRLEGLPWGSSG